MYGNLNTTNINNKNSNNYYQLYKKQSEEVEEKIQVILKEKYGINTCQTPKNEVFHWDLVDHFGRKYEIKVWNKSKIKKYNELAIELTNLGDDKLGWFWHVDQSEVDYLVFCLKNTEGEIDDIYVLDAKIFGQTVKKTLKFLFGPDYFEIIKNGNLFEIENKTCKIKKTLEGKYILFYKDVYQDLDQKNWALKHRQINASRIFLEN